MTQNNITDIEKCARFIFGDFGKQMIEAGFNPRTNKADLMDLECELNESCLLRTTLYPFAVVVYALDTTNSFSVERTVRFTDHPTKFTARAEAVIAVAVQIYDARYGKDGE